ncbi:hypothetical protein NSA47_09585 [Irregularibacter muris]|uniref:Virginiamycin B lyase n=1 Tax=Irregularibacter muris TaxID=1796619 RepID=A0AAE3KZV6_9FIRM|nr:hypothetical protein [Irregularibacter muris]MCR1899236.1 hypothetical protein [Irregularibacter muris]
MNIKINEYKLPMDKSGPYGITVGPNGAMWFTESRGNKIGRITSKGEITEYLLPTLDAEPLIIAKGIDGALWFTEYKANKIGKISIEGKRPIIPWI